VSYSCVLNHVCVPVSWGVQKVLPFSEVVAYVSALFNCRYCYCEKWATTMYPQFEAAVNQRLFRISDDELKELDRNAMTQLTKKMNGLRIALTDFYSCVPHSPRAWLFGGP
jgi:hypothetical protein